MLVLGKVVGGWTNPFELNSRHLGWFPQVLVKIQKLFETIISALVEFIVIFVTHVFVFSSKKNAFYFEMKVQQKKTLTENYTF